MGTGTTLKQALDAAMPLSVKNNTNLPGIDKFEDVELDEDEIEEALRRARENKFYMLKRIAYNLALNSPIQYRTHTAAEYFDQFNSKYQVDESNATQVMRLCQYFSKDEKFAGDLTKGIILVGGVGVGKTTIMEFFMKNQRASYRVISCRDVEQKFSEEGSIDCFTSNPKIAINSDPFGHQVIGFCFDDMGTESNAKNYGREKNIMADIILNRYDAHLDRITTHVTTNLTLDEIATQYGSRVYDRMKEMFNIIAFDNAKSRRK